MTVVAIKHTPDGVVVQCEWFDNPFQRPRAYAAEQLKKVKAKRDAV